MLKPKFNESTLFLFVIGLGRTVDQYDVGLPPVSHVSRLILANACGIGLFSNRYFYRSCDEKCRLIGFQTDSLQEERLKIIPKIGEN